MPTETRVRTPFAQALLGKKVGEEATLEMEGHNRRFRIEGIEPYVATAEESADANKPKIQLETDHGTGNTKTIGIDPPLF